MIPKRIAASLLLVAFAAFSFTLAGCKKDDPDDDGAQPASTTGTFELKFLGMSGDARLWLGDTLPLADGTKYTVDKLRFYAANIRLVKEDGSEVELSKAELVDFDNNHRREHAGKTAHGEGEILEYTVPVGRYKGVRFILGLDSTQNFTDPATYEASHPLSISQGMYWTWASGYRFVVMEGYASDEAGEAPNTGYTYHTGTNPLARSVDWTSLPGGVFEVRGGTNTDLTAELDVAKIFETDPAIHPGVAEESQTHTMGPGYPLAERFTNNMMKSWKAYISYP